MIPHKVHKSWHPHLASLFESSRMKALLSITDRTLPAKDDIFNVFQMPLEDIKVVILGQDPYPQPGYATGYAFAVPEGNPIPRSLRTLSTEAVREFPENLDPSKYSYLPNTLQSWIDQGVFLLNTALTVERNQPGSLTGEWEGFTSYVISTISVKHPAIWMLWGSNARGFNKFIARDKNDVIVSPHPAASAYGGPSFIGCGCFREANTFLESRGEKPIKWI